MTPAIAPDTSAAVPAFGSRGDGIATWHRLLPVPVMFALALAVLLLAGWFAYRPGLGGTFLLDDFSSLDVLGTWGPVNHMAAFWRYITAGAADPTGRPLALLSFLIDANDWPAAALPFKTTNVLLHLLNGTLLCWALLKVGRRHQLGASRANFAALVGAGIWLLHPLLVSTTLYVVQREAMLAATFAFIGIICWCVGRDAIDKAHLRSGIVWLLAGAWPCTLLAALCKANGFLLPLLLAMLELTVLRGQHAANVADERKRRAVVALLLGLPITLLGTFLLYALPGSIDAAPGARGWTVGQRLLTEPRILIEYLRLLWIPQTTSFGVFYDQVQASTGWIHPWTTLPCAVFTTGLIAAAFWLRRRFPAAACAILFYFAGQLLESSFLPLQLAFEHRNYLPAVCMFWPLGVWLSSPRVRPLIGRTVAIAVLCVFAIMTWTRAGVWGNPALQASLWARLNPDSPQAQTLNASMKMATGDLSGAVTTLRDAATRMPNQPQIALTLVQIECHAGSVTATTWDRADYALANAYNGWNNIANWFVTTTPDATTHRCNGMTLPNLSRALAALKANPAFARWHTRDPAFARATAVLDMAERRPESALAIFDSLLAPNPDPGTLIEQARALNAFGYPDLALRHLDRHASLAKGTRYGFGMTRVHAWILDEQGWWPRQVMRLHRQLAGDVGATTPPTGGK